ncbi:hypothetical protein ACFCYC_04285 [Streptomyces sp. NPDC056402]|uniref:hypothetical protein n=1 Tax=Streptomyces sp. NPDC056402 TaxID=3345810 RepID=UPI0035D640A1
MALPGKGEPPQLWLVHAQEEYAAATRSASSCRRTERSVEGAGSMPTASVTGAEVSSRRFRRHALRTMRNVQEARGPQARSVPISR